MKVSTAFFSFTIVSLILVSTPFVVNAQSADQLRSQIAEVLAQIYALRAQLQPGTVTPITSTVPVTPLQGGVPITPSVNSGNGLATFQYSRCPDLQFNLERGNRDRDVAVEVTMAQRFFAQDSRLYPEAQITGFFGPATERAVQRFQERHGIVAKGDYQSTGYGRIGPRTRWAIKNSCGAAGTHSFGVSPVAGAAPLRVSATFEFKGSSCTSYQLDWGDGSTPVSQQAPNAANCSNDSVRKQATHTYANGGAYVVTLRIGQGSVYAIPIVGRANVVVQGFGGSGSQASLFVSTIQGRAPLTVQATLRSDTPSSCTSYEVDWGDNSRFIQQDARNAACTSLDTFTQRFTHVYQNQGIYTLRARAGRGAVTSLPVINQRISVNSGDTGGGVVSGCFVEPNNGRAPLATQARILFGGTLCDGALTYSVDWGDGSSTPTRSCSDQNSHYEQFTHIYNNTGTYTARLSQSHPSARFAEQTCTVNVSNSGSGTINSGGSGIIFTNSDSLSYRVVNSNLRTVEFTALINAARECNGGVYTIYFGDSTDSLQPYPADACQLFTRNVSHTYSANGTYNALLLKNGIIIDQVTVSVHSSSGAVQKNLATVISVVEKFIQAIFK
ncbi:MAG: peptidoglycan-binding protein [Candidatus Pacebacteria bacterium]|nr:peptidoglycan-binding protein [Candidatus Paceibacterota bacterium]